MGWLKSVGNFATKTATNKLFDVAGVTGNILNPNKKSDAASEQYGTTMDKGMAELNKNYEATKPIIQQGYSNARAKYQTPEIAASRAELYQRVMGKGGYSPETVNSMKGSAIEQGGVQKRDAGNALNDRYGDASGGGMTGENLARSYNAIGANQANALRDVDINQAKLQEEQQTGAIPQMYADASAQAGLDTGEAGAMAGLTTEQAKALAEMLSSKATGQLQVGSQKGLLSSILS